MKPTKKLLLVTIPGNMINQRLQCAQIHIVNFPCQEKNHLFKIIKNFGVYFTEKLL